MASFVTIATTVLPAVGRATMGMGVRHVRTTEWWIGTVGDRDDPGSDGGWIGTVRVIGEPSWRDSNARWPGTVRKEREGEDRWMDTARVRERRRSGVEESGMSSKQKRPLQ